MHKCIEKDFDFYSDIYGEAISECSGEDESTPFLWVFEGEYASRVNYCPYCGYKAIRQVKRSKI